MQGPPSPNKDNKASVPTEHLRNVEDLGASSCKASKRTFPWDLPVVEIQPALSQPQDEDEDIRETKRPRLREHFSASTDEATTRNTPHDTTVALPPPVAAADHADSNPVMDMPLHWTREEDES
jgi:hypothetical protein